MPCEQFERVYYRKYVHSSQATDLNGLLVCVRKAWRGGTDV